MRVIVRAVTTTAAAGVLAAVGCSSQSRLPADDTTSRPAASAQSASPAGGVADTLAQRAKVVQLEADARALAGTTGCNAVTQCRTAPVGEKACGGPRDYIAYCAATTDSVALFRKLGAIKDAEVDYNKSSNTMSTCEFRLPPKTSLVGGSCRAASAP